MRVKKVFFPLFYLVLLVFTANPAMASESSLNELRWHPNIRKGTILAWKITELELDENDTVIAAVLGIEEGTVFKFELTKNLPTDLKESLSVNLLDYVNIYLNDDLLNDNLRTLSALDDEIEFPLLLLGLFVIPTEITFDNSTTLEVLPHIQMFNSSDLSSEIQGEYMISQLNEDNIGTIMVKHHTTTGIVAEIALEVPDALKFRLEFYTDESNIDIEGDSNDSSLFPSFALNGSSFALVATSFGAISLGIGVLIFQFRNH